MKKYQMMLVLGLLLIGLITVGCSKNAQIVEFESEHIILSELEKNDVKVIVAIDHEPGSSDALLTATFTPIWDDYHLYSKDIPLNGIGGIGRPTLLELTASSQMASNGILIANQTPITPTETIEGDITPPIYPAGPVTLSLPVTLPVGDGGKITDQISISYMICGPRGCKPPVMGYILEVDIPTVHTQ